MSHEMVHIARVLSKRKGTLERKGKLKNGSGTIMRFLTTVFLQQRQGSWASLLGRWMKPNTLHVDKNLSGHTKDLKLLQQLTFQKDKDPQLTARATMTMFQRSIMCRPIKRPDLNIIKKQ
ncbi:hypothetical protein AMECASPLE_016376 [Ameca splendens]|uniref:Uncharacterized protein n=1 Tax=Ameca splendens TaxID=208324 RepID=A0ABV0YDF1_9TELE